MFTIKCLKNQLVNKIFDQKVFEKLNYQYFNKNYTKPFTNKNFFD